MRVKLFRLDLARCNRAQSSNIFLTKGAYLTKWVAPPIQDTDSRASTTGPMVLTTIGVTTAVIESRESIGYVSAINVSDNTHKNDPCAHKSTHGRGWNLLVKLLVKSRGCEMVILHAYCERCGVRTLRVVRCWGRGELGELLNCLFQPLFSLP